MPTVSPNIQAKATDRKMARFHRQPFLALAVGFVGASVLTAQATACSLKALAKQPIKIPICELLKKPQKYSGNYVELSGIFQSSFEYVTFRSPDCSAVDPIWAEILDPKLRATLDRDGISFSATAIGRFRRAPDTLVKTKDGSFLPPAFGFLGQFRNLIEIECFHSIQPIQPPH